MDAKYLAEIKAREQAATPGPWDADTPPYVTIQKSEYVINAICAVGVCEQNIKDADFIAHARTDIPALLAEVERLMAENAELKAQIEPYQRELHCACAENATLKKALELACEEITKHTCECPASLYGAEMCENCNDDDCDSNRTDRWCDYFIQAQEQEGKK